MKRNRQISSSQKNALSKTPLKITPNRPSVVGCLMVLGLGIMFVLFALAVDSAIIKISMIVMAIPSLIIGLVMFISHLREISVYKKKMRIIDTEERFLGEWHMNISIAVPINDYMRFLIDTNQGVFGITPSLYAYSVMGDRAFGFQALHDILSVDLSQNGNTMVESHGGTGGAIVGGLLFGAVGAIIGSTGKKITSTPMISDISLNIILRNMHAPRIKISFIGAPVITGSEAHYYAANSAEYIYSTLQSYLITRSELSVSER